MSKGKLFNNKTQRNYILKSIYNDYAVYGKSTKEMAKEYGYTERQLRYIIDRYLLIKKGKGKGGKKYMVDEEKENIIEKLDDDTIVIDGKLFRKCTIDDLLEKSSKYIHNKNRNTIREVEN